MASNIYLSSSVQQANRITACVQAPVPTALDVPNGLYIRALAIAAQSYRPVFGAVFPAEGGATPVNSAGYYINTMRRYRTRRWQAVWQSVPEYNEDWTDSEAPITNYPTTTNPDHIFNRIDIYNHFGPEAAGVPDAAIYPVQNLTYGIREKYPDTPGWMRMHETRSDEFNSAGEISMLRAWLSSADFISAWNTGNINDIIKQPGLTDWICDNWGGGANVDITTPPACSADILTHSTPGSSAWPAWVGPGTPGTHWGVPPDSWYGPDVVAVSRATVGFGGGDTSGFNDGTILLDRIQVQVSCGCHALIVERANGRAETNAEFYRLVGEYSLKGGQIIELPNSFTGPVISNGKAIGGIDTMLVLQRSWSQFLADRTAVGPTVVSAW